MNMSFTTAIRGNFFDIAACVAQPQQLEQHIRHIPDGLMLLNGGTIAWYGGWGQGEALLHAGVEVTDYRDKLIVPGFIDTHIHYPQTEMIGAYGEQLLSWLQQYTFPTESQYCCKQHAERMSAFFLQQLLSNGTTTALVFGTIHPQSVEALFEQAARLNMRLIAGKVMMDRHAPQALLETPMQSYLQTRELILRWHGKQRLSYAITPRFAPTSTPELLAQVQRLHKEFPDVYLHTHLSETPDEVAWVKELFPENSGYLDVYHQYGLTGRKSVFAHCLHLEEEEWNCLHDTHSAIAFCPTSNLFLGSGLFNMQKAWQKQVNVGIGTDVGAGTTFNMLQTLGEAYKVGQLQHYRLSAGEAFYHATLGGARALGLEANIGNFTVGKEADFVVLDPAVSALQALRHANSRQLADQLFVLMTLGDDRNIYRTYVDGKVVYQSGEAKEAA
ncbi:MULTISPECIES: guanine deaminase [Brenneria]|uniref:Guanine deaminase n=1 Tax=Brenneria nigrifluens DSM 30175 = ATCC 13028 TaxID=1121120 RepID=A0A2U1ULX3_9GAMM|nr:MULTISPECIES: guanine deaminase [Brenneria]EHD23818.1 guanine deaminase [Brenneria sp. EniD312]PWC22675.1 guanine deaminase [Brenneria nigrifluens] [Brenneria nigrifluens DSM 30175 = ATCC 13028]QCR06727.1 guanine deaminase [Brenneria nigrifluens] [Brenneria nigrifluens DSM 30175 = ATCC 13028]